VPGPIKGIDEISSSEVHEAISGAYHKENHTIEEESNIDD